MSRFLKFVALVVLFVVPLLFYFRPGKVKVHRPSANPPVAAVPAVPAPVAVPALPKIALIFDDLGENLNDIKNIYALGIPATVAILPGLRFSTNIAALAERCGIDVFVHLPLEPRSLEIYKTPKYTFIGAYLKRDKIVSLLRYYLNSIPGAIGVNNHMGSVATLDRELMSVVLDAVKAKGLIFVDSRTVPNSVAYDVAIEKGLTAGYNDTFLDPVNDEAYIERQFDKIIVRAQEKGRIIVIAHPHKKTMAALKKKLSSAVGRVRFITISDYFDR